MQAQTLESVAAETAPTSTISLPAHLSQLVLTGFMGAGKTTIGRLLAPRLGWEFLDLDAFIEARTGLTVPSIFSTHGEARFRQLESQALASALGRRNTVLALGGGTPEILTNRLLLEQTPGTVTIFLDAPFPTLFDRCLVQAHGSGTSEHPGQARPVLADQAKAEARFRTRHTLYRRLARHTISTAGLTPEETIATLLAQLNTSPPSRGRQGR